MTGPEGSAVRGEAALPLPDARARCARPTRSRKRHQRRTVMPPDTACGGGLSDAALDVGHALEALARDRPEASAPQLVLWLARRYIPARLKRWHR